MNPLPDHIQPLPEASAATDQRNRMQRVGIVGNHSVMHLETTMDNDTVALSSTQSQFFEPNNPFLAPPSRTRQSSSRRRQRQEVQQAHTHQEDDDGSLSATTNKTPVTKRVTVASSRTGQQEHLYNSEQASAPFDGSNTNRNTDGNIDYRNATFDDFKHVRKDLKAWEADFKATHGRAPTQDDVAKDEIMVKKYRAYSKLKKAFAESRELATTQVTNLPEKAERPVDPSSSKDNRTIAGQQTPTKQLQRTTQVEALPRTPKRNQEVEYVSPRNVALMSPRNMGLSPRNVGLSQRCSTTMNASSMGDALVGSTTPKSQQHPRFTVTERSDLKSSPVSTAHTSPATRLRIRRSTQAGAPKLTSNAMSPSIRGTATPSQLLRTPTRKGRSSQYLPNPFQSPSLPKVSPLFGGMNNRRTKRPSRPTAHSPDIEDLESAQDVKLPWTSHSPTISRGEFAANTPTRSAILSTPQKSGAAKMARSLFRSPSFTCPASPSLRHQTLDSHFGNRECSPTSYYKRRQTNEDQNRESDNPVSDSVSVHEAMDSMTIDDDQSSSKSSEEEQVVQGFDNEDDWDYGNHGGKSQDDAFYSLEAEMLMLAKKSAEQESNLLQSGHVFATSTPNTSPFRSGHGFSTSTPKTPSQPSLTFSQPTPGSAKSEIDIFVVPPGFHSHFRRRQVRTTLFSASQGEDERFEKEFLGPKQARASKRTVNSGENTLQQQSVGKYNTALSMATDGDQDVDDADDNGWEETESETEGQDKQELDAARKPAPKKRSTQKRSTRLHRIAVAPSEKSECVQAATKPSVRTRRATKALQTSDNNVKAANDGEDQDPSENNASVEAKSTDGAAPARATRSTTDESTPYGWANSNKPMIKSDKHVPGVGLGRAGPRRSTTSKFGGPSDGGNYVAYNLQRSTFKKGGGRGKSRFGGSKFASYSGAGGPGTGRTLFDSTNWRTEFDQDFNDDSPALTLPSIEVDEVEDDGGVPWYGQVNDETDPHVVTISREYLRRQLGEVDDPDEYVKSLEQQQSSNCGINTLDGEGHRVNLQYILNKTWRYPSFRDGQLEAIKRILKHESTLLVLPTGSGKSLSYQLPAYVFSKLGIPSLTLVISPMISLMYDQVKCLPPGLTGACWTSAEQSAAQFKDFMERLTSNTIKILFISPEKLQSQSFLSLVRTRRIPPIYFLCVDEVHCLSEWSHNFRPAYLLLNHVLKTDLKSPCVLGLTGTATEGTKDSICAMLEIDRVTGVLSGPVIRHNLAMTVSLETDRETALLHLLQSPRFATMDSILIYVMKQSQADALASFLRVRNFSAESYHAGKSPLDRQRIQNRFMSGGLQKGDAASKILAGSSSGGLQSGIRILVATIAFGLGLNKSNIRSVIHYCMPKSLENYIQEIGRSGRDGKRAYCHMFLNQDDYLRLRSLTYGDGMDWGTVLRLIKKLFSRKSIDENSPSPRGSAGVKSTNKKRRGVTARNADDENEVESHDGANEEKTRTKRRKQNDHQPLDVKVSSKTDTKLQGHVISTSSILAIPPAAPGKIPSNSGRSSRLVVVREELIEEEFDIKKEVLATLLSYIELDVSHPIKVQSSISAKCAVKFIKTSEELSGLADQVPLIDMILKQGVLTGHQPGGSFNGKGRTTKKAGLAGITLSMAYCCDTMTLCQQNDMTYTELVQELQLWKRKKWAVFEFADPALCVEILSEPADCMAEYRRQKREEPKAQRQKQGQESLGQKDAIDMYMDVDMDVDMEASAGEEGRARDTEEYEKDHDDYVVMLTDRMYRKLCAVERVGVAKVDRVYELFQSVATPTWQQQDVFKAHVLADDDDNSDDSDENQDDRGAESSEYEEDVDPEYIRMRAKAKAKSRASQPSRDNTQNSVTESEAILQRGIQDYFARSSGEGIGGLCAEEEFFQQGRGSSSSSSQLSGVDRTVQLYTYESPVITALQRKWRSAVEVDLKVFLNQLWQQQSGSLESIGSRSLGESPRAVSRIFHGISSPCYPALEWHRHRYWAKYVHFDFGQLMLMTDRVIKEQRQQRLSQQN